MATTSSSSKTRNVAETSVFVLSRSSCTPITLTSDVFLSIELNSLPSGGMTNRAACGSTTRRIDFAYVIPSDFAASACPGSTDRIPARMISDM